MKTTINGIEFEGTPQEILEIQQTLKGKIEKPTRKYRKWTPKENLQLITMYRQERPASEIARYFNRSEGEVTSKIKHMRQKSMLQPEKKTEEKQQDNKINYKTLYEEMVDKEIKRKQKRKELGNKMRIIYALADKYKLQGKDSSESMKLAWAEYKQGNN